MRQRDNEQSIGSGDDVWSLNNVDCYAVDRFGFEVGQSYLRHALVIFMAHVHRIYKDNYGRLNMIGRKRSNRALIGCDSQ